MELNSAKAEPPNAGAAPAYRNGLAVFLAFLGVGVACALAPFANGKPAVATAVAVFPIMLIALLGLPAFQCMQLGPRILLILLAIRPLVDVSSVIQTASVGFALKPSSALSLQEIFAAMFGLLLVVVWVAEGENCGSTKLPNILLIVLLGLTTLSWLIGGLNEGARGCVRTAWGLLVALLLGSLFHTEKQVDIFVRTLFYSSIFVLITLGLNLSRGLPGDASDAFWRLSGQYGDPNALAGVVFSFFVYGLYVFGQACTARSKVFSFLLLYLLAVVIISTQSRTVGGLMLISVCLWLWANGWRWLLYGVTAPLVILLFASAAGSGWRLASSFSLRNWQVSPTVLTLTGRISLWSDWLNTYSNASSFHKVFGLGWGVVLRNFLAMGFFGSSVTENSFLWFLVGTGVVGLLAFCGYLLWVLLKSWSTWKKGNTNFQSQFALVTFLATLSLIVEGFTTDVASAPNADIYIFAVMSFFVFQWFRNPTWRTTKMRPTES